jgi:PAS domain S-box-containing protein
LPHLGMQSFATERGEPEPIAISGRQVIEEVRDQAIFMLDRWGRVASWNKGVGRILGWAEDDWIGQPVRVAFTPDDVRAGVPETEMCHAATHGHVDDDRWMQRRNGERFFALGTMTRLLDERGALVGFVKMMRDLTVLRRSQAEREHLLASESRTRDWADSQAATLTAAIDAIADGVCIGDRRGVRRSNAATLRILGVASADDVHTSLDELVQRFRMRRSRDGPVLCAAELPFSQAIEGHTAMLEIWATKADRPQDLWLRCAAAPICVDGRVVGAVTVLTDLSERLQLHEQRRDLTRVKSVLQERNAELRAVADSVRDYAIFTISPEGLIDSWHQGAARMKGYSVAEAIGMPFERLFTMADRRDGRPAFELELAARTGEFKGDGMRLRKDGSTFEAAVVLTALRGDHGELLGFLKLTQDISQRKRMGRELEAMLLQAQQARQEAEHASKAKDEFLATISHELRTPLSAILGWAHVLERGVSDPATVRHGLLAISRNARTQVQLIEDLLDMNRIETGQLRLDLQRIELGAIIAAAIDAALPAATAKGIGLCTVFGAHAGAVMGDATRLRQVVTNLLNNAVKFTSAGGQVSVTLTQSRSSAQIIVADSGHGIDAEFLPRLFDRFQQQDASTTRRHGGLGIGLSIVRQLVESHGGSIQAHSLGAECGATFTVTLPTVAEDGAVEPSAGGNDATDFEARLDGVKVLLVDDEADVRAVTQQLLQNAGAEVVTAVDAEEALQLLREHRPAVILSDIGMPVTDGYDLMRRVRELSADEGGDTPAAAFTAYTRPEDSARALSSGFQMHLSKPVAPAMLVGALARLALGESDAPRPSA